MYVKLYGQCQIHSNHLCLVVIRKRERERERALEGGSSTSHGPGHILSALAMVAPPCPP